MFAMFAFFWLFLLLTACSIAYVARGDEAIGMGDFSTIVETSPMAIQQAQRVSAEQLTSEVE